MQWVRLDGRGQGCTLSGRTLGGGGTGSVEVLLVTVKEAQIVTLKTLRLRGELPVPLPPRGVTAHLGYSGLHYDFFQVCFTCERTLRTCTLEGKKIVTLKTFCPLSPGVYVTCQQGLPWGRQG